MFGTLPIITLLRSIFKLPDNIWKILYTNIYNGIPWLFVILCTCIGLDTQIGNQPLSWCYQNKFGYEDVILILSRMPNFNEMSKGVYLSLSLILLYLLTLQRPKYFMFKDVNSPSVKVSSPVNFSSQNVFRVYQLL